MTRIQKDGALKAEERLSEKSLLELEAKVLAERWKREYNTFRPHSSLDYKSPAPEAILCPALS